MNFGGKSKFPILNSPEMDQEKMLFYLEKQLKYEGAINVTRHGDLVIFSSNVFTFIRMRTFLEGGGRGFLRVATEGDNLVVVYRLSFVWAFLIFLVGNAFLAYAFILGRAPFESLICMFLAFYFGIGANILIHLISLAMFIERTFDTYMKG
ncbi:MAG: hypothetical protein JNM55_19720 [Anaerolineales bacterium]|nr:hypothetical protein [Anaerolineales bacterium]